jgi:hypothetical protein
MAKRDRQLGTLRRCWARIAVVLAALALIITQCSRLADALGFSSAIVPFRPSVGLELERRPCLPSITSKLYARICCGGISRPSASPSGTTPRPSRTSALDEEDFHKCP